MHETYYNYRSKLGLGYSLARYYISDGWNVAVAARRKEPLLQLQALAPDRVVWKQIDVSKAEEASEKLSDLIHELGGMDVYLHCAGIGRMTKEMNYPDELPTLTTNVTGWTACVLTAYNFFLGQNHGTLAAITSFSAIRGLGPAPAYSATKAYQAHYLEALSQRLTALNTPIHIVDLRPGFVDTPLLSHPEQLFWVITIPKAVHHIVRAIGHKSRVCILTRRWRFFAPILCHAPHWLVAKISCKAQQENLRKT